ncbi:MAG TPA: winged helix-turn-helix domain-containing protein [Anaerolineales bacterium]|nr:winged helix-turn-helix domain-containing protein [Anaerolineales bacterium]
MSTVKQLTKPKTTVDMRTIMSITKAAEELLERSGTPMHYKEITDQILHECDLHGNTPYETVRSSIGRSSKFIRIAEGVYALSKWKKYKPARFAKDIAYDILKLAAKPMSLINLGDKVLAERKFKGKPNMIVKNAIRQDARFYLDKRSNMVYLIEWKKL